jgi:SAM-dependent methyltransferase
MLSLADQVATGKLVCPRTGCRLLSGDGVLVSEDGTQTYRLDRGTPILLADERATAGVLAARAGAMVEEYERPASGLRRLHARLAGALGDQRSRASEEAFQVLFRDLPPDALCLSVGGGPRRIDERLVNLNLGAFANVDVVADAYRLPYAAGAVDAVHCEAVLEHLEFPDAAVAEMARVLGPGRLVFAATPFLQAYHGYPDHFQNFTESGHRRLFERAGFEVLEAGTSVGGAFALRDLAVNYLRAVAPRGAFGKVLGAGFSYLMLPILWLDRWADRRSPAPSVVASTTYLLARKPSAS